MPDQSCHRNHPEHWLVLLIIKYQPSAPLPTKNTTPHKNKQLDQLYGTNPSNSLPPPLAKSYSCP